MADCRRGYDRAFLDLVLRPTRKRAVIDRAYSLSHRQKHVSAKLFLVEQFVNAHDPNQRDTRCGDRREAFTVFCQVRTSGGLLCRNALLFKARDFGPHIAKIGLEVIDLGFIGEGFAVPRHHGGEIKLLSSSNVVTHSFTKASLMLDSVEVSMSPVMTSFSFGK